MKKNEIAAITLALFAAAAVSAAMLKRWRDRIMPRRDPRMPFEELQVTTEDGLTIAVRRIPGGGRGAVIVAHPAVTGQRYSPLLDMAETLIEDFDVYTFDFRGHGSSGGRLELNLAGPLEDMRAVVGMLRSSGYMWVGVVGFSLGGMAAFVYASLYGGLDAVVMVSALPRLPDTGPYRRVLPAWSLFLRFLGARFKAANEGGPLPIERARDFPDVPLLVVHGANEWFYSRDDLDEMLRDLGGKAELWVIEGAGHTELSGREREIADWLLGARARWSQAGRDIGGGE